MARDSKPFLGESTDRAAVFARFKSIAIEIKQDPLGMYTDKDWPRVARYTKGNVPRRQPCVNPRCRQGGIDLQMLIEFSPAGTRTIHCEGHEGTPQGRPRGDSCSNSFVVTLTTELV